jgi:hypothetical protein
MSQNLVSLSFSAEDIAAIDAAIGTLENKFAHLVQLSVDDRRSLTKMGEKSESVCRQTLMVLAQDAQVIPPGYDLAEAQRDLAVLDLLRPRFSRIRLLRSKADDTEMALGSDVLAAALEGYAIAKAFGKGAGLDSLKEAMATRFSGGRRAARSVSA